MARAKKPTKKSTKQTHGCLAPGSKIRGVVVRDRRPVKKPAHNVTAARPVIRDRNYGWAELMKRVFDLGVLRCPVRLEVVTAVRIGYVNAIWRCR